MVAPEFRARFGPVQPGGEIVPNARVEEFRMLQKRIGTTRNVVVTPRAYVTDNRVTLDAIARLEMRTGEAVAMLAKSVPSLRSGDRRPAPGARARSGRSDDLAALSSPPQRGIGLISLPTHGAYLTGTGSRRVTSGMTQPGVSGTLSILGSS